MSGTVRAIRDFGFVGQADGQSVRVDAGDEWPDNDPFVAANEHMFEPVRPARVIPRPGRAGRKP